MIRGIKVGRGGGQLEITHLFFGDNTLIFYQSKEEMILNLRCILLCFQAVSRLNISLQKFELVILRSKGNGDRLALTLGCKIVNC